MLEKNDMSSPVVTIAGLKGGSGKTFVSLGITSAFVQQKKIVSTFKKGPDYIDAGWLSLASGRHCFNLDTYMCAPSIVRDSFFYHSHGSDISIIEGNRGLFDAIDINGHTSTAEIAKLVGSPVIVCIDCTKATMTMAAVLMGLQAFDSELDLAGVVFNKVAGPRHAGKLVKATEYYTDVKVIGSIPRVKKVEIPERHMGLVPTCENDKAMFFIEHARKVAVDNLDLNAVYEIAKGSGNKSENYSSPYEVVSPLKEGSSEDIKIGVIMDDAFQFYYPENIIALENSGAKIVQINAMTDESLPEDLDALYIGGGFPESFAAELEENSSMRKSIKDAADGGLPVYAECGGLIYLGESIEVDGEEHEMCGFFPLKFGLSKRPQGHGYVEAHVSSENPFADPGDVFKGHEFRYSTILSIDESDLSFAYELDRGVGIIDNKDGVVSKNVLASYLHLHFFGADTFLKGFLKKAKAVKTERE